MLDVLEGFVVLLAGILRIAIWSLEIFGLLVDLCDLIGSAWNWLTGRQPDENRG